MEAITKINNNTYINMATLALLLGAVVGGSIYFGSLNEKLNNFAQIPDIIVNIQKVNQEHDKRISTLENKDNICHICKTVKDLQGNIILPL